ncbi:MAG: hypothetical protein FJW23_16180 [Acidimicrobiia bacterium]|nr:hypothetical protein [Acidimicrobiia bacterium]
MRIVLKLFLSVAAWLVLTLIVAAVVEVSFGEPRPGLVPLPTLILLAPVLYRIWRKRPVRQS